MVNLEPDDLKVIEESYVSENALIKKYETIMLDQSRAIDLFKKELLERGDRIKELEGIIETFRNHVEDKPY